MTRNEHPDRDAQSQDAMAWWDSVLDSNNLEPASMGTTNPHEVEKDIFFASSPDWKAACSWLENQTSGKHLILDLGAGLGAHAFAFARRGHQILAVDSSLSRLLKLMERARVAGCADLVIPVVASAEQLPFGNDALHSIFTKSVLIHTSLAPTAKELHRVLTSGGRAACIEPQPGNPFVKIYRKTVAPREWAGITRYFDREAQAVILSPFNIKPGPQTISPCYFFSFFAFIFQYAVISRPLFYVTLGLLNRLDGVLFRIFPGMGRWAWFGLIRIRK
jgi:ubiquinone/menaquinone biosynthesis C-methylase UbiE